MLEEGNMFLGPKEMAADLLRYEKEVYEKGYKYIAGIDEVGRGPIAGPVVAAAVILPAGYSLEGANDSKQLSVKMRERLVVRIKQDALAWAVCYIYPPYLDEINILNATKEAMKRSIQQLNVKPDYLLIDAVQLSDIHIEQRAIIKGDTLSLSIACASILAKVERDASMAAFDHIYPGYHFGKHKGYGTREHIENLFKKGPCNLHRKSFQPVKSMISGGCDVQSTGLFDPDDVEYSHPGRTGGNTQ